MLDKERAEDYVLTPRIPASVLFSCPQKFYNLPKIDLEVEGAGHCQVGEEACHVGETGEEEHHTLCEGVEHVAMGAVAAGWHVQEEEEEAGPADTEPDLHEGVGLG